MTPRGKCSDRGSTPRASTKTLVLLYLYIGVFVVECLAGMFIAAAADVVIAIGVWLILLT